MRLFTGILFALSLFYSTNSTAQVHQLDSIIVSLDDAQHPGGVIGVMRGDTWLYQKAFGQASLEYEVPNRLDTRFNIASISKQFTAAGILMLAHEGKLSVDDDVRNYLPELPDFGTTITLRHLLHHTSGMRSHHAIQEMAGWGENDVRNNEELLDIMTRQQELNFQPGEAYSYCNTGYILMGEIIKRLTGQPFEEWMQSHLFNPLQLTDSYIEPSSTAIVPRNATSYYGSKDGFHSAIPYWDYTGSGNVHTTLDDLMHWYGFYLQAPKGWEYLFEQLQTQDNLNSGSLNHYAFGVEIDDYRGVKRIQHGGAVGGYRSFACAFPDQDLRIIVLTNFSSSDPIKLCNLLSNEFLTFPESAPTNAMRDPIQISNKELKAYTGYYWNDAKHFSREIRLKDGKLWYVRETNKTELRPVGPDLFQMTTGQHLLLKFDLSESTVKQLAVGYERVDVGYFSPYTPTPITSETKEAFSGMYFSPELLSTFLITHEEDKLYLVHPRLGKHELNPVKNDFVQGVWPLVSLEFYFDDDGKVLGFRASNNRAQHVRFEKL